MALVISCNNETGRAVFDVAFAIDRCGLLCNMFHMQNRHETSKGMDLHAAAF